MPIAGPAPVVCDRDDDAFAVHRPDEERVRKALHVVPPQVEALRSLALDAACPWNLFRQASAFHQVSVGDAPFLILHGDTDPAVPLEQSARLHEALQKVGCLPNTSSFVKEAMGARNSTRLRFKG